MLAEQTNSDDNVNRSHDNDGVAATPEGSLLGNFMKRQRVNSAASKFEFSFKPTFKLSDSKPDLLKLPSDPVTLNEVNSKPYSFRPMAISSPPLRPRDKKAADRLTSIRVG